MRKFSRFFVFFLFTGLFTLYAPLTQADMQQQGDSNTIIPPESQHRSYGSKVGNKALSAFANLTTSVLEIPKNIINTTNKSNIIYGAVGGLFKGLIHTAGRIGVGITDLVTLPLPTKPIAQPEYIWNDFDVDTRYGPVFRLDPTQQAEPVVQDLRPEPAVIAPKPEAIDNSKQYHQETNHKLDTLFKKEMMK